MAVRLIVDSGCDILPRECEKMGIIHVPLKVIFGTEVFADAVDMTHREFYERLVESDTLPTTSQVAPGEFSDACEKVVAAGDTAVIITVSGKLSGTYQSAMIAASEYEGKVFVVDSEHVSLGQRILVERALTLLEKGLNAESIAQKLDEEKKHIRVIALLDTLEYLKKGGRISSTVALAGSLLSIKPVVALEEGSIVMAGKARGSKQGNNLLRQMVEKSGGINFAKPFCLAYSGLSDVLLQKYIADSAELWEGKTDKLPIATVGCTIGTHARPGAIALAYFEN
jgi:DegV family protein with EDD domain